MRVRAATALGVFGFAIALALPVAAENAAHDLANRFAGAEKPSAVADDDARRKAYEAEMLERARQEAEERARAEKEAAGAARQRELEAQREAESRALADKLKRAEEARQARNAASKPPVGETTFKPALTNQDKAVQPEAGPSNGPVVVKPPQDEPPEIAREAPAAAPPPEPARELAREPASVPPPPMALGRPQPPAVPAMPSDPRVTILLVMEPGKKGIRRFNKTADPVICDGETCFVSKGSAEPARVMPMRKALGPGNTFGKRAGACRGKLACVFRGVELEGSAPLIQPVDLKVLVHDRREARIVSGDRSCQVLAGKLSCARTIVAPNYRAWIVPERIAEQAGPEALEAALRRGLLSQSIREAAVKD